ncbi:MAG TPA: hypothetical protein VKH36_13500 [Acidimicrobiia bacterium]|nr:hypothetical protein [Acidimicrobiia bacterium]
MRRLLRQVFMLSVVAGTAYVVWKWFEAQRSESGVGWEPQPAPYPPKPRVDNPSPSAPVAAEPVTATEPVAAQAARASTAGDSWVEPADGTCPASHPVKAKMSSGIFHVEGGLNYDRIHPDRCYRDPAAAEADGLRKANR